jgi:CheY-like chemotaxis protein
VSLKIMIADEEASGLKLMRSLAAPLEHVVLAFEDGKAAVERAEAQRFDVAFVGSQTVGMDGFEVVRGIRESEMNRETLLVMVAASDTVENMRKAFGEGADLVIVKPLTAARLRPMLAAMDSPGWKHKRHAARMPLFTEVVCTWNNQEFPMRSMNISESGMLMQGPLEAEEGQKVSLEFKIGEVRASLTILGMVARKEDNGRTAVEFIALAPEARNAIQLYVMGRLKDMTPQSDFSGVGMRRLFNP